MTRSADADASLPAMPSPEDAPTTRRPLGALVTSNLMGGIGVASSVAVGGLLIESVGFTALAGVGQAFSVLGAALVAIPLAKLAARRGRRWSLGVGYAMATAGAATVVGGAVLSSLVVVLTGLLLFGVAQATNLQSRYAATDGVPVGRRGRVMSIVVWATTVGVVVGPNLSGVGRDLGVSLGLPGLSGPYLFSVGGFVLAGLAVLLLYPGHRPVSEGAAGKPARPVGALVALRWATGVPSARSGVALVAGGHGVMVSVMVMTPLHMQHHDMTLEVIGLVISVHTFGMYAFSPVFGWLTDRLGAARTAWVGVAILALSLTLGLIAAGLSGMGVTMVALFLLGLGWSAATIAGSTMVASVPDVDMRVSLQGATDATMNYVGAGAAALAGPILALGGFYGVNLAGAVVLAAVVAVLAGARGVR
ncbi:MFS transporter [Georgenia alba]|uniref:MFS transporter n=1 Tax=Georgenia alba TaxID=2233858 RepID=A0ABW2Q7Q2_9MICO